jgi:hypothetical protein
MTSSPLMARRARAIPAASVLLGHCVPLASRGMWTKRRTDAGRATHYSVTVISRRPCQSGGNLPSHFHRRQRMHGAAQSRPLANVFSGRREGTGDFRPTPWHFWIVVVNGLSIAPAARGGGRWMGGEPLLCRLGSGRPRAGVDQRPPCLRGRAGTGGDDRGGYPGGARAPTAVVSDRPRRRRRWPCQSARRRQRR